MAPDEATLPFVFTRYTIGRPPASNTARSTANATDYALPEFEMGSTSLEISKLILEIPQIFLEISKRILEISKLIL